MYLRLTTAKMCLPQPKIEPTTSHSWAQHVSYAKPPCRVRNQIMACGWRFSKCSPLPLFASTKEILKLYTLHQEKKCKLGGTILMSMTLFIRHPCSSSDEITQNCQRDSFNCCSKKLLELQWHLQVSTSIFKNNLFYTVCTPLSFIKGNTRAPDLHSGGATHNAIWRKYICFRRHLLANNIMNRGHWTSAARLSSCFSHAMGDAGKSECDFFSRQLTVLQAAAAERRPRTHLFINDYNVHSCD